MLSRREDRRPRTDGRHRRIVFRRPWSVVRPAVYIDRFGATAYIAAMAVREILILPDKRLRLKSEPVKKIDAGIRKLVEDMFETMYDAPGIGLAAIQIGTPKRVVTMDLSKKEETEKNPQVFINPEVLWSSDETATYEEGCLSIPEFYGDVERPKQVKVKYLDLEGKAHEIEADGLLATCLQHEIDHTNGVLFIDHLSKLKRDRVVKKFAKAAKRAAE
jgi:peptide deformylase